MKIIKVFVLILVFLQPVFAQKDLRERMYMHLNSESFVSGETLRFSIYNMSDLTGKLVNQSKTCYVELIGENGVVYQGKLPLSGGRGDGYIFIKSDIPTGQYKLMTYTQWMKNFEDYFVQSINIINPFEVFPYQNKKRELEFNIISEKGFLVKEVENELLYELIVPDQLSITKGKVVNHDGEVIQSFEPKEIGVLRLKPNGDQMKVVLEDAQGGVYFFNIEIEQKAGYLLKVERRENGVAVTAMVSPELDSKGDYTLLGANMQSQIYKGNVWLGQTVKIDDSVYGGQQFQLTLIKEGVALASVWVRGDQKEVIGSSKNQLIGIRDSLRLNYSIAKGSYSVSVRKAEEQQENNHLYAVDNKAWFDGQVDHQKLLKKQMAIGATALSFIKQPNLEIEKQISCLPEVRNEYLKGVVKDGNGELIQHKELLLSIPGKKFQLIPSRSNDKGEFMFYFDTPYRISKAFIVPENDGLDYDFSIESKFISSDLNFSFDPIFLDSISLVNITKRSIRNQVYNAHLHESDSIEYLQQTYPLINQFDFVYKLDEYNRFPQLSDYFIEYIQNATIRKKEIRTIDSGILPRSNYKQLTLLDGLPVDSEKILDHNPYSLEKISVLRGRYFLGQRAFEGVVLLESYDGVVESGVNSKAHELEILPYASKRTSSLGINIGSNEPDFREELYWNPEVKHDTNQLSFSIRTSDITGKYIVRIEGVTEGGTPVSVEQSFRVK